MLLKGEIAIDRHKDIVLLCRQRQQLAVSDSSPAALGDGCDLMRRKVRREASIDALIE